jgi:peptide/nickel transport system ATP-binding protein
MTADPRNRGGPGQPLLLVNNLRKHFPVRGGLLNRQVATVQAVDDISFSVRKGETLGIVGESGCGKSTTARLLMRLIEPDAGDVVFDGDPVADRHGITVNAMRRQMQMVFQDSYSSLNPRMTMAESIAYAPRMHGVPARDSLSRAEDLLVQVGLNPRQYARRYPHELSGGQRQRVNIARALALEPRLVILDEAVSALDKSIEAQVLNLLSELKARFNLTYLFISHDLNVVEYVSDRVLVMYLGRVVELGPTEEIFARPLHPYTRALLGSRPSMDPAHRIEEPPITGDPPSPIDPPSGCRFRTRCPFAEPVCAEKSPELGAWRERNSHVAACHMLVPGSGHSRSMQ